MRGEEFDVKSGSLRPAALSIFVMLLFATVAYSVPRCSYEPNELGQSRLAKLAKANEQQCN